MKDFLKEDSNQTLIRPENRAVIYDAHTSGLFAAY